MKTTSLALAGSIMGPMVLPGLVFLELRPARRTAIESLRRAARIELRSRSARSSRAA